MDEENRLIDLGPIDISILTEAMRDVEFSDKGVGPRGQLTTAPIGQTYKFSKQGLVVANRLQLGAVRKHMASILIPGQGCEYHIDEIVDGTLGRVHIPIFSNEDSWFCCKGGPWGEEWYNLKVGRAYIVPIHQMHRVFNAGSTPRIHYMFDYEEK